MVQIILTIIVITFILVFLIEIFKKPKTSISYANKQEQYQSKNINYPDQKGKIKVLISELDKLEKLSYNWDVLKLINDAIMLGNNFIYLKPTDYDKIKIQHNKIRQENRNESIYWELKYNAIQFEKVKNYDSAANAFEKAFQFAISNNLSISLFSHGFERLIINYRKTKQKEKEIEALKYMLENYSDWNNPTYDKWNERLAKLI